MLELEQDPESQRRKRNKTWEPETCQIGTAQQHCIPGLQIRVRNRIFIFAGYRITVL